VSDTASALFEEATGDVALGELDAAIAKYRRCVELDDFHFDAWHALGMALMKTGQIKEAIAAGERAVALRPNDQLAWSSLSLFHVRDGNIKAAEAAGARARIISWGGDITKAQLDDPQ
jgi:tetratricopeptide (TPR) repeat protein